MVSESPVVARLREALPDDGTIVTDPDRLASYRHDEAQLHASGTPSAVVLPRTTDQVRQVLLTASRSRTPVVPQGALTGVAGAVNAVNGCIVLSLRRMNRILAIEAPDRYAVVEPGVVTADLARAASVYGLAYPRTPRAERPRRSAGTSRPTQGACAAFKYGVTADFVLGLESSSRTAACWPPADAPSRVSQATT